MRRFRVDHELLLPMLAVFLAAFLQLALGLGFTVADIFIFAMIALWLPLLAEGQPRGVLDAVLLPLALILLGSFLGALTVGVQIWIVVDLVKDVGGFAAFLAMVTFLRRRGPAAHSAVAVVAAASTIIIGGLLLADPALRAQAGFPNPNVAGHFLATNLIVLMRSPVPRWLRIGASLVCVAALIDVGSFGSLLMLVAALAYLGGATTLRVPPMVRRGLPVLLIVGLVLGLANLPETTDESGFNARHFERSSEGRVAMWTAAIDVAAAHPMGVGPGSNRGLRLLPGQQEAHNEYLAYLTERGVIGLLGLLLLYLALWRTGRSGGLTRALVIGFALQSAVRETFHYRHLWLLLALAIVLDERVQPSDTADLAAVSASGEP